MTDETDTYVFEAKYVIKCSDRTAGILEDAFGRAMDMFNEFLGMCDDAEVIEEEDPATQFSEASFDVKLELSKRVGEELARLAKRVDEMIEAEVKRLEATYQPR